MRAATGGELTVGPLGRSDEGQWLLLNLQAAVARVKPFVRRAPPSLGCLGGVGRGCHRLTDCPHVRFDWPAGCSSITARHSWPQLARG